MNDSNIIIKITSETDLSDAQLQIKELQEESKRLQTQMENLSSVEKEDAESIKKLGLSMSEQTKALKENEKYYRDLKKAKQDEINSNEKSINSLKKSVSTYNAMNNSGKQLMTRIRELRNSLSEMEMAGDTSSEAFIEMSVAAAKLQDQMGDTSRQIQILASDTKEIDAMIDVASGLTGVFTTATSAVALFTDENEALQRAFLKVQAAMSILNGIQQVANTLNKDSTANVVLKNALSKLSAKFKKDETVAVTENTAANVANATATNATATATKTATTATKSFTKALKANPIMLVVAAIATLVAGGVALYEFFKKGAKEAREFNKAINDLEISNSKLSSVMSDIEREKTKALNEILKKEAEYNKEANKNNDSEIDRIKKSIELQKEKEVAVKESLSAELKATQDNANFVYDVRQKAINRVIREFGSIEKAMDNVKQGGLNDDQTEIMNGYFDAVKNVNDLLKRQSDIYKELSTADEERLRLEEELKNKRIEQKKEERDMRISLMKDGEEKEIAIVNARYDDERKVIVKKYGQNTTLLKGLEDTRQKEISEIRDKYINEFLKLEDEYKILVAEIEKVENPFDKSLDIATVTAKAEAEINDLQRQIESVSGENSEERIRNLNARIVAIQKQTEAEIKAIKQSDLEDTKSIENLKLQEQIDANNLSLANEKTSLRERRSLIEENKNFSLQQITNEMSLNESAYKQGLISQKTYLSKKLDLDKKYNDTVKEYNDELLNSNASYYQEALSYAQMALQGLGQIADEVFGLISDKISAELEELDNLYTTDAQEAKENANKKYISEKELENKKMALKIKEAKWQKAQAVMNATLNAASAIIASLAQSPVAYGPIPNPVGIASLALATTVGALQVATALATPLPKYEKGRKATTTADGEYALVGEKGAEIMFVPRGAGIIPHDKIDKQDAWRAFNVPKIENPAKINMDKDLMSKLQFATMMTIDYNRLGKAVADNVKIPKQTSVSVNVDRNGVTMSDGIDTHRYLNKKYAAVWN